MTFDETLDHYATCTCDRRYPLFAVSGKHDSLEGATFVLHNRPLCNPCIRDQWREDEFGMPNGKS